MLNRYVGSWTLRVNVQTSKAKSYLTIEFLGAGVSSPLAWTVRHPGPHFSASPTKRSLLWWWTATCSPTPPAATMSWSLLAWKSTLRCVIEPALGLTHLVVVAIGDGIGLNSSLFHLEQHLHCQNRLAVLTTQLQQYTVTHLRQENPKNKFAFFLTEYELKAYAFKKKTQRYTVCGE